jgi:hypothetical protein
MQQPSCTVSELTKDTTASELKKKSQAAQAAHIRRQFALRKNGETVLRILAELPDDLLIEEWRANTVETVRAIQSSQTKRRRL